MEFVISDLILNEKHKTMYNKEKMTNSFDKRLPKTTTYWTEGQIFFVKNTNFFFSKEKAQAMIELLIFAMKDKFTKGLVIDNREARSVWTKEIYQMFESNEEYKKVISNKKMATLTNSSLKMGQTNRLSKKEGILETSKTFNTEFNDEVKAFLLA